MEFVIRCISPAIVDNVPIEPTDLHGPTAAVFTFYAFAILISVWLLADSPTHVFSGLLRILDNVNMRAYPLHVDSPVAGGLLAASNPLEREETKPFAKAGPSRRLVASKRSEDGSLVRRRRRSLKF